MPCGAALAVATALGILPSPGESAPSRCPRVTCVAEASPTIAVSMGRRRVFLGASAAAVVGIVVPSCPAAAQPSARPLQGPLSSPYGVSPGEAAASSAEATPWARAAASASSPLRDTLASAAGGAAQRLAKEVLLHPIDTVRCRLEIQGASRSLTAPGLFSDLYAGVLPSAVVGTPAGALFFATKDALKHWLKEAMGSAYSKEASTILAVLVAQLPYWAVRTPAELVKTRAQAGTTAPGVGGLESARSVLRAEGIKGLFVGFGSNVAYAAPTDVVKFLTYEAIKRQAKRRMGGRDLNALQGAVCGALGSAMAQAVCTPLDVIRTRLIAARATVGEVEVEYAQSGDVDARNYAQIARKLLVQEGVSSLFAGLLPRVSRSLASGAIQFGAYEGTRRLFGAADRE